MKVLAICGSMRAGSSTGRAVQIVLEAAQAAGAEVDFLSLSALDLPFCDGRKDEETYGGDAAAFRSRVLAADAILVGSPEYHGSMTGSLKNALDLLGPQYMRGKMVGLLATARGDAGAMNTLNHLRHVCRWMEAWVLPNQVSVPTSQDAFGPGGEVLRPGLEEELLQLGAELVRYAGLLAGNGASRSK